MNYLYRMSSNFCKMSQLVAASVSAANEAGNIIREVTQGGKLEIVEKGVNDPQTIADRRAQHCIVNSLRHLFPTVTIIAEENIPLSDSEKLVDYFDPDVLKTCSENASVLADIDDKKISVWVDPLDGTLEYTKGNYELVTVLIGISVNGRAEAGVIHQPFYKGEVGRLGRTIWGIVGLGAFGQLERNELNKDERILVTTHTHETPLVKMAVAACQPTRVLKIGGAGYKFLLLIERKAHAFLYTDHGYQKWDTCAPDGILRALGGATTNVHGDDLAYLVGPSSALKEGVVALIHSEEKDWYIERIPSEVKTHLARIIK